MWMIHSIPFSRLKELGIERGHITNDDILRLYPEAEQNIDYLDQIYLAMRNAGISVIEENSLSDILIQDSTDEEADGINNNSANFKEDNYLMDLDPDNLVGLYFSEATRFPLLTIQQEVTLAKRIEQGFLARGEISDPKIKVGQKTG